MIHVVSGENQHYYGPQLDQMFALRKTGALDRVGPAAAEIDAFDDEQAIYLMNIDSWGELSAAVRAHPGAGPVQGWRLARWVIGPKDERTMTLAGLLIGVLEFCEGRELARIGLEAGPAIGPWLKALEGSLIRASNGACELAAGPDALIAIRQRTGIAGRLLLEIPGARSAARR